MICFMGKSNDQFLSGNLMEFKLLSLVRKSHLLKFVFIHFPILAVKLDSLLRKKIIFNGQT